MALQILLPLNGTLENQGLNNSVSISNVGNLTGAANKGKLYSMAYDWSTDGQAISLNSYMDTLRFYSKYSMCAWVYYTAPATNHSTTICSSGNWNHAANQLCFALYSYNSGYQTILVPNTTGWSTGINTDSVLVPNTWYHICITYDGQKTRLYINGSKQKNEYNGGGISLDTETSNLYVGCATYYPGFTIKGTINDFRIYDHCLSMREIQDISNGLIIHYKFNTIKLTNLLPEVTTDNYTGGTIDNIITKYSDYSLKLTGTTDRSEVFLYTAKGVNYTPGHTYYGRAEIYQKTPQGGCDMYWREAEPRIIPHNTVTKARTWTIASAVRSAANIISHRGSDFDAGLHRARFDYNNSKTAGEMWFDGMMLIDLTEAFGAGNEPSKEWCDNNIPYFIGTYEKTGYENSAINIYNGSASKALGSNLKSKYYLTNSVMDNVYITTSRSSQSTDASVSMWLKTLIFPTGNEVVFVDDISKLAFGFYAGTYAIVSCGSSANIFSIKDSWINNEWNHVVLTKSGEIYSCYINGVKITPSTSLNNWTSGKTNYLIIGCRHNGSYSTFYNGEINDFKLYATALPEAAVKDLYATPISLSNNYTLLSYELLEKEGNSTPKFTKRGQININAIADVSYNHHMPIKLVDDGSVWARIHWLDFSIAASGYFANNAEVDVCTDKDNRFSLLKYVDNFKTSDGIYEFMLTYPLHATKATDCNRWKQTNSPNVAYGAGTGYEAVGTQAFSSHIAPLTKCNSSGSAVYSTNTSGNWWSPIGQKTLYNNKGIPAADGSTQLAMELWVRIDNIAPAVKMQIFKDCLQSTNFIEW